MGSFATTYDGEDLHILDVRAIHNYSRVLREIYVHGNNYDQVHVALFKLSNHLVCVLYMVKYITNTPAFLSISPARCLLALAQATPRAFARVNSLPIAIHPVQYCTYLVLFFNTTGAEILVLSLQPHYTSLLGLFANPI